jgi:hypothetical protein
VLKPANPKARDRYEHAVEARQRALQASTTEERDEFLSIEKGWLGEVVPREDTARGYEIAKGQ